MSRSYIFTKATSPRRLVAILFAMWIVVPAATALAVVSATTTDNKQAPPDDPGWSNIGQVNGSTGVYIGNRLVVTARHVDAGEITFEGAGTFQVEEGSRVQLTTSPAGDLSDPVGADLVVFRLTETPDLPALQLGTETPETGAEVLMIGYGRDRAADATFWEVNQHGTKTVWTESDEPADDTGFKTLATRSLSWGTNVVEDDEPFYFEFDSDRTTTVHFGGNTTAAFVTEFDDPASARGFTQPSTAFESQAVTHDSGGAVFQKQGEDWELVGIITNVDTFEVDQPSIGSNPVFGNVTLSADIASYRDQILANIRYATGDFDKDGTIGVGDIDMLTSLILEGTASTDYDLDGDGVVNGDDRLYWVEEIANTYLGDANLNGEFGTEDLVAVFTTQVYEDDIVGNATWATGDWNGDGDFDSSDMVRALQGNGFERGPRPRIATSPVIVPEPSVLALISFFSLTWFFLGRRPQRFPRR